MQVFPIKLGLLSVSMLALAACGDSGPRTHDSTGRAVASPAMASAIFMNTCFKPGGGRAAAIRAMNRDKNIEISENSDSSFTFAKHKTHSVNVTILSGVCSVSFDSGGSNVEAATGAAQILYPQIGVKSVSGEPGGGQINFKTNKGTVVVGNAARVKSDGAMLSLYTKN